MHPASGLDMNDKAARSAPTVSVCVFAYNHEKYLAQALDSVLSQRVNFPFEVIVAEDYSSDSTFQIARGYQELHPDLIRVEQSGRKEKLLINGHQTGRYNFFNALGTCRGKYVAFLDGDDYWVDPDKLQRQVDYLEAHPDCSFVFHNVYLERGDRAERKQTYLPAGFADKRNVRQLLIQMNYVQTSSVLFRNNIPKEFPRIFHTCMFGDWPLHVFNLNFGYPEYMGEVMSVYRIGSGSWTRKRKIDQMKAILDFYDQVAEIAPKDVIVSIPSALARNHKAIALEYLKKGQLLRFCRHSMKALWLGISGSLQSR